MGYSSKKFTKKKTNIITPRELNPIKGNPTVSLIIPTMKRQKFTQLLLEDHKNQTYLIKEAVIVDATPAPPAPPVVPVVPAPTAPAPPPHKRSACRPKGNGDRDSWIQGLPALEQTSRRSLRSET